jgi:hypothetical protein
MVAAARLPRPQCHLTTVPLLVHRLRPNGGRHGWPAVCDVLLIGCPLKTLMMDVVHALEFVAGARAILGDEVLHSDAFCTEKV